MSHLSTFKNFWKPLLKYKNAVSYGEQEKRIYYLYEDGIEKSIPHDHHLSSHGMPERPNSDLPNRFFYPTLTLMMDSYNIDEATCLAGLILVFADVVNEK